MAAEWIKWTKGLARKPEVIQIAHRLGVTRHAAAGLLMEVWEWADDNVVIDDGASGFDPDNCPGSVRLGDQSASLFDATFGVPGLADAMTAVGWIEIRSGSLTFPNFARHNGKSAKARALDSARKRTARQSSPDPVPKPSGSQPDKTRIRGEEKREEERSCIPPPAGRAPATKPGKRKKPAGEKKLRAPNPLFDAVAEVTGLDPDTAGGLLGGVTATLAKKDPPYTPDDVRAFASRFHELCPHAARDHPPRLRPTPKEVERYIGLLRAGTPPVSASARSPTTTVYDRVDQMPRTQERIDPIPIPPRLQPKPTPATPPAQPEHKDVLHDGHARS